jgi:hypothetical protein
MLAKANLDPKFKSGSSNETHETYSRVREIGTQSMFRESEAQTDPFTPQYTIEPGSNPEVLKLINMTHGTSLAVCHSLLHYTHEQTTLKLLLADQRADPAASHVMKR